MKYCFLLLYTALNFSFIQAYAQTGTYVPELASVDEHVSQFMQQHHLTGGSVALVKDGRLVYARGFGMADTDLQVTPDHLFRIASLSKPVTAIAIMKLIEDGYLKLDDYVFGGNGILNEAVYSNISDNRIRQITIQQLLQHTAGWDRNINQAGDPMLNSILIANAMAVPAPANAVSVIQYVLKQPLDFDPGTNYAYSNVGYCILGRVIEKITGMSYDRYVKEKILLPLQITHMQLGRNLYENKDLEEVKYYDKPGMPLTASVCENGRLVTFPYGGFNLEAMDAHGGWIASASDLARLVVATDGFSTKPDILHGMSIQTMVTPSAQNPNYAMGWCVNEAGNWWHSGSLAGSSAFMARLRNGLVWVVLFNGNPQTQIYFKRLDKLMWQALEKVNSWPSHDLFMAPVTGKISKH